MSTAITDLSLYRLDTELAQLLSLREEMAQDGEDTAAIESEIKAYMEALPAKVSGVCAIFRMWKGQQAAIKAEEDRLHELRKRVEANEARLKEYCAYVLEQQSEPKKGCKKLIGVDGSQLLLKGNGGLEPLGVDHWDNDTEKWTGITSLPIRYKDVLAKMPADVFERISSIPDVRFIATEPANARIREALAQPCSTCDGTGRENVEAPHSPVCQACGGTGKQGIPGARLLERGKHVEIR